ncbi:hypothetical protein NDI39_10300 [Microcoleus sp. ZQ-A2]
MKLANFLLVSLILIANLLFAQPSWADKPSFLKNPDYIEVNQSLNALKMAQETQAQTENYNPEQIQNKIDELEFQKYALETGINWGQCENATGKTLAVYGPQPKFDDDDDEEDYPYANGLYFLADGQTTKNKWDCQGVYLPSDAQTTISSNGQNEELAGPAAIKVVDGTQLIVRTNADTGAIEFSIPPTQILKTGEANWFIPKVSQAVIDTRVANAPTAKKLKGDNLVVMTTNPEKNVVESNNSPNTQGQSKSPEQAKAQPEASSVAPKPSYLNRR